MNCLFNSFLAGEIQAYIDFKCALGYSALSYEKHLRRFDEFCCKHYPEEKTITEQIVSHWTEKRPTENTNGHIRRMIALKGFLDFLKLKFEDSYVIPSGMIGQYKPCMPYLYSDEELESFFLAADTLPVHPAALYREETAPVIFRMLYCCGMRPQEPLRLKCSDLDLRTGTVYIADSKNHKDRVIIMSEDMRSLCVKYNIRMEQHMPCRTYFFERPDGRPYDISWLQNTFHLCIKRSALSFNTNGRRPRVYDFRHNFATRVIQKWISQGIDTAVMLPRLSAYMGHAKLKDTAYYIHLVPEHFKKNRMNEWSEIPEVPVYED